MPILWQIAFASGYALVLVLVLLAGASRGEVQQWKADLEAREDADDIKAQAERDLIGYVLRALVVAVPLSVGLAWALWEIHRALLAQTFPGDRVLIFPWAIWLIVGVPHGLLAGVAIASYLARWRLTDIRYRALCVRDTSQSSGRLATWGPLALMIIFVLMMTWVASGFNNHFLCVGGARISHSTLFSYRTHHIEAQDVSRLWLVFPREELDPKVNGRSPHAVLETGSLGDYHITDIAELNERELHDVLIDFADRNGIPYRRVYRWPLEKGRTKSAGG